MRSLKFRRGGQAPPPTPRTRLPPPPFVDNVPIKRRGASHSRTLCNTSSALHCFNGNDRLTSVDGRPIEAKISRAAPFLRARPRSSETTRRTQMRTRAVPRRSNSGKTSFALTFLVGRQDDAAIGRPSSKDACRSAHERFQITPVIRCRNNDWTYVSSPT